MSAEELAAKKKEITDMKKMAEKDLQEISERVASFEGKEENYKFSGNVDVSFDIEDGRKAMIKCTGTLPKPAMAIELEKPDDSGRGTWTIRHDRSLGICLYISDEIPIVPILIDTTRQNITPGELEDIGNCAKLTAEKWEEHGGAADEARMGHSDALNTCLDIECELLRHRFLRKLNILEYCKNIEIDERQAAQLAEQEIQARAGGGTELGIGVTRPSSPTLVEGVSGGAAGPPRGAVTRPVSPDTTGVTVDTTPLGVTRPSSPTLEGTEQDEVIKNILISVEKSRLPDAPSETGTTKKIESSPLIKFMQLLRNKKSGTFSDELMGEAFMKYDNLVEAIDEFKKEKGIKKDSQLPAELMPEAIQKIKNLQLIKPE